MSRQETCRGTISVIRRCTCARFPLFGDARVHDFCFRRCTCARFLFCRHTPVHDLYFADMPLRTMSAFRRHLGARFLSCEDISVHDSQVAACRRRRRGRFRSHDRCRNRLCRQSSGRRVAALRRQGLGPWSQLRFPCGQLGLSPCHMLPACVAGGPGRLVAWMVFATVCSASSSSSCGRHRCRRHASPRA